MEIPWTDNLFKGMTCTTPVKYHNCVRATKSTVYYLYKTLLCWCVQTKILIKRKDHNMQVTCITTSLLKMLSQGRTKNDIIKM